MALTIAKDERETFRRTSRKGRLLERAGRFSLCVPLSRPELGDRYIEDTRGGAGNVLVRMRPERWLTVDYAKQDAWEPGFEGG